MSTRANIKLTDDFGEDLWLYRHSDGYPEGALPTIDTFMNWVRIGQFRDNVSQSALWLMLQGVKENGRYYTRDGWKKKRNFFVPNKADPLMGWKAGSMEPTTGQHEDIEYLYTLDLKEKIVRILDLNNGTETEKQY